MNYVLFIGSRVGYEALNILVGLNCSINHVFIEAEHKHESEKYYQKSREICLLNNLSHTINTTNKAIVETLEKIDRIDYIMSFGYRKMIQDAVVNKAEIAALGTHFSPLPRYRGFAPLNWVLINGEEETAVNLFYLDSEVDSGDIIATKKIWIEDTDDINTLFEKCLIGLKDILSDEIPKLEKNSFLSEKQDETKATYTCSRNPGDGLIDWNWDSRRIYNFVRALTYPFPGAFTYLNGEKITIWTCEEYDVEKYEGSIAGKVIKVLKNNGVVVLCGKGAILIKSVGLLNGDIVNSNDCISSIRLTLGTR